MNVLALWLSDQIPSGKNHVRITRTGRRYPTARFAQWRATAYQQLHSQLIKQPAWRQWPSGASMSLTVYYRPLDRRQRDVPGMLDALLHLLERAEVIQDDAQVKAVWWTRAPTTQEPCVLMVIATEDFHSSLSDGRDLQSWLGEAWLGRARQARQISPSTQKGGLLCDGQ
jgi:Holliday junction resolvase RusA-like endonuclease